MNAQPPLNTTSPTGLRIHLRHVRAIDPAGGPLCAPGIRAWCRQHTIDLRALCTDGIDLDAHPQLHDDPFVARAIAIAVIEAGRTEATHVEPAHASERADAP